MHQLLLKHLHPQTLLLMLLHPQMLLQKHLQLMHLQLTHLLQTLLMHQHPAMHLQQIPLNNLLLTNP